MIVSLTGRFGNQLFQYAAGLSLAEKIGAELQIDISQYLARDILKDFALKGAISEISIAEPKLVKKLVGLRFPFSASSKLYWQFLNWIEKFHIFKDICFSKTYIREPHFQFWDGFFKINESCFLYGVWQTEKYFKSIRSVLLAQIKFGKFSCQYSEEVSKRILSRENSVAIHVRRGDYLRPTTAAFHGVCSLEYYQEAIQKIRNELKSPVFYVFSDDPEWIEKEFFKGEDIKIINPPPGTADLDSFWLMRNCRHQIIANSSFSWWAAWLNENTHKIVIAPKRWFANSAIDTSDIYPMEWLEL